MASCNSSSSSVSKKGFSDSSNRLGCFSFCDIKAGIFIGIGVAGGFRMQLDPTGGGGGRVATNG